MANQFANVLVQAIAGAAAGWASAVTKQDFLSPIIRAQENIIGQKQKEKERAEDKAHAKEMVRIGAELQDKQIRLAESLKTQSAKDIASYQDSIDDLNRQEKFLNAEQVRQSTERSAFRQNQFNLMGQAALSELEKGNLEPMKQVMNMNFGSQIVAADKAGNLGEPGDGSVTEALAIQEGTSLNDFVEGLGAADNIAQEKELAQGLDQYTDTFNAIKTSENLTPTEQIGQYEGLQERVRLVPTGFLGVKGFDTARHANTVRRAEDLIPLIEAEKNAAVDTQERIKVDNSGDYTVFGPNFIMEQVEGEGFSQLVPKFTGNPNEETMRRRYADTVADFEDKYKNLSSLAAALADPSQDLSLEDIPKEDRAIINTMISTDEAGVVTKFAEDSLMDFLMNNREKAPTVLNYLRTSSESRLANIVGTTSTKAAERRFTERKERVVEQVKISKQDKNITLKDAGFEFKDKWFFFGSAGKDDATRVLKLAPNAEVEIVEEILRASDLMEVTNPSNALRAINTAKSLGTRLGLSDADKTRLLRQVTPKFDEVEAAAFAPGASFETIGIESAAIDENPIVELYYNRADEFHITVADNFMEEGFSTNDWNARQWELKNWVRMLRNTVDPVVRQEIYKKYGMEDYYDENIDAFLIEGGSRFGKRAILAALPSAAKESKEALDTYKQKRDSLELEMARLEAEGKTESQDYKAKAIEHAKLGIIADTEISETNVNDAKRLYAGLGRAICLGEAEVLTYMKLHRKADTGFELSGDDDALEAEIKAAYKGDFEDTLGEMLSIYLPAATMEGRTTAGKADFIEFINATYPHVAKAVEAASQYDPGTVPVLVDTNWWNTKRDVKFRNLSYLFSTSEDLTEFER